MATVTWNGWCQTPFGAVRLVKTRYAEGGEGFTVKSGPAFQCRPGDLVLSWPCQEITTAQYRRSAWAGYGVHARQGMVAIPAWQSHNKRTAGPFVDNSNVGPSLLRLRYCTKKKTAQLRANVSIGPNRLLTVAYGRSYGLSQQRRARAALQQAARLASQAVPRPCRACSYFCAACRTWLRQKDRFAHRAGHGRKQCQPVTADD
jgi:hypothetical protein